MTARMVSGVWVATPAEVIECYRPRQEFIAEPLWGQIRPLTTQATTAAQHASVEAALAAVRATAQFLAWATREEIPLTAERVFRSEHVERYIATQTWRMTPASRSTRRSHLRRVARAATKAAPWPQPERPYARTTPMLAPLTAQEENSFWEAVRAQPSPIWERRLKALMVLGLGAGLPSREALTVTIRDHFRVSAIDDRLWLIELPDRQVPIDHRYVSLAQELSEFDHEEPLVGPFRRDAKNPMAVLTEGIAMPPGQRSLRMTQFRTTWMKRVLERDVRISEFQAMSGIASAKTLETIAPFIDLRAERSEWLLKGAGL